MFSKKTILLAAFGGLVMSIGFVTRNWTKIVGRFSEPATPKSIPALMTVPVTVPETKTSVPAVETEDPLLPREVARENLANGNADKDKLSALLKLPVSERPPVKFRGLQTTAVLPLKADEWSRQVIIPSGKPTWWKLEINPPYGYYIRFADDSIVEAITGKESFGDHQPPFRLLGKSVDQGATIKISSKPFKNLQNP